MIYINYEKDAKYYKIKEKLKALIQNGGVGVAGKLPSKEL